MRRQKNQANNSTRGSRPGKRQGSREDPVEPNKPWTNEGLGTHPCSAGKREEGSRTKNIVPISNRWCRIGGSAYIDVVGWDTPLWDHVWSQLRLWVGPACANSCPCIDVVGFLLEGAGRQRGMGNVGRRSKFSYLGVHYNKSRAAGRAPCFVVLDDLADLELTSSPYFSVKLTRKVALASRLSILLIKMTLPFK